MVGVGAKKAPEAAHLQAIESLPFHFRLVPQSTDCREYFKKKGGRQPGFPGKSAARSGAVQAPQ